MTVTMHTVTVLPAQTPRLHWTPRLPGDGRLWAPEVVVLPPHPVPEVPARPLADGEEAPAGPCRWLALARRSGWTAQICYSRGTQMDARGHATRLVHTWSVRGKILAQDGSQGVRRLYASWHQVAGAPLVVNLVKRKRPGPLHVRPAVTSGEVQITGPGQPLAVIGLAPSRSDPARMHLARWIEGVGNDDER